MGMGTTARSTAGSFRAFPTFGRRLFFLEQRVERNEIRQDIVESEIAALRTLVADQSLLIQEISRRCGVLEKQTEQLHIALSKADPYRTLAIVSAVRDNVAKLTTEITEQMNQTSQTMRALSGSSSDSDPVAT